MPAPAPVQTRNVGEVCAGRNLIAQALCESRECAKPEHAGEAMCKRFKADEDRRRRQEQ